MGAAILSLVSTALALMLVAVRRNDSVDVPADAGDGRERRARGRCVAAVVPATSSPAVHGIVSRLVDHVDRVVVVDTVDDAAGRLADLSGHASIDVLAVPDGPGTAVDRARSAGVRHALVRHAPRAVLVVEVDAADAVELVPELLAQLAGHDAVIGAPARARSWTAGWHRLAGAVPAAVRAGLTRILPGVRWGLRLYSTQALLRVPLDTGDASHVKAMVASGLDVLCLTAGLTRPPDRAPGPHAPVTAHRRPHRVMTARILAIVLGVIVVAAGVGLYTLTNEDDVNGGAEAILENPDRFAGERATVTGDVESFFPGAFTVGDSTWGEEMLIAPAAGADVPQAIRSRTGRPRVRVTGTVRIKDDSVELVGGEQGEPFSGRPYIEASRIEVVG